MQRLYTGLHRTRFISNRRTMGTRKRNSAERALGSDRYGPGSNVHQWTCMYVCLVLRMPCLVLPFALPASGPICNLVDCYPWQSAQPSMGWIALHLIGSRHIYTVFLSALLAALNSNCINGWRIPLVASVRTIHLLTNTLVRAF
jgi:hypothetical protein